MIIAGIDEAGRGPLAGPVVASAVVFQGDFLIKGITDSKKITAKKREELFLAIKKHHLVGIGIVANEKIDQINILQATFEAMKLAVNDLPLKPDLLLVDGNFIIPKLDIEQKAIIKGDEKEKLIGAASIIAKVTRDNLMLEYHKIYPQYNFAKHKGYGTKEHRENITKYGLSKIHRKSFCKKFLK